MTDEKAKEGKTYKNPILYLRKSKAGKHLYAFNVEGCLGETAESLVMNISDISAVIEGRMEWAKVSVLVKEEEKASSPSDLLLRMKRQAEEHMGTKGGSGVIGEPQ